MEQNIRVGCPETENVSKMSPKKDNFTKYSKIFETFLPVRLSLHPKFPKFPCKWFAFWDSTVSDFPDTLFEGNFRPFHSRSSLPVWKWPLAWNPYCVLGPPQAGHLVVHNYLLSTENVVFEMCCRHLNAKFSLVVINWAVFMFEKGNCFLNCRQISFNVFPVRGKDWFSGRELSKLRCQWTVVWACVVEHA